MGGNMIRKCLLLAVTWMAFCLAPATSVVSIRIEDFQGVASRMVLDLNSPADFVIEPEAEGFYLGIEGFDGKLPSGIPASKFIRSVQLAPGGIQVTTIPGLRFERMKIQGKAVVDMFIKAQTKAERMAVAAFYSKIGKLASADNAYHQLAIEYRNHDDVLYHWGRLLLKRESPRAGEKLAMIPASSRYYAEAQRLMQGGRPVEALDKAENPPPPPPAEPPATADSTVTSAASAPSDTAYIKGIPMSNQVMQKIKLWDALVELALRYFVVTIIIFVSLLVILIILISYRKPRAATPRTVDSPLDSDAMLKMAARLTTDGWTTKEIARELKISPKDAESLIRRSHYVSSDSEQ